MYLLLFGWQITVYYSIMQYLLYLYMQFGAFVLRQFIQFKPERFLSGAQLWLSFSQEASLEQSRLCEIK